MKLSAPLLITARLMPGLRIGDAYISLDTGGGVSSDNRTVYRAYIDLPDGTEHEISDLRSGCGGGGIQEGLGSLLSFLGAAAECYAQRRGIEPPHSMETMFPPAVVEWAYQYGDEISMLQCDLEEGEFIS